MIDVAALLSEAAQLSQRSADLAAGGRLDEALELEARADDLRRQVRKAARSTPTAPAPTSPGYFLGDQGPTTRQTTISALNEIGVPASPRMISDYSLARFAIKIEARLLAALRRDERRAWTSGRSFRPVYIVPALEGRRFLAIRGKLALSDWSLERRLIGPWSERADHLTALVNVSRQVLWLLDAQPDEGRRLTDLLVAYARGIGSQATPDPRNIEQAAQSELTAIGQRDNEWRQDAARRARQLLSEDDQLWGAEPPRLVGVASGE